ncbi:MAG: hypothetical protein QM642_08845 [Edaphocola sp.]
MPLQKIKDSNAKGKRAFQRFRNRVPLPNMLDQKTLDLRIMDTALAALYNEGDTVTLSLKEDVLNQNKIHLSDKGLERIWDVMINTGLVNPVVGFGNAGKLNLTKEGYQLMADFGSYTAFVDAKMQAARQQNQTLGLPQLILTQMEEPEDHEDGTDADGEYLNPAKN